MRLVSHTSELASLNISMRWSDYLQATTLLPVLTQMCTECAAYTLGGMPVAVKDSLVIPGTNVEVCSAMRNAHREATVTAAWAAAVEGAPRERRRR
jgi:hypothetical protein